jgi:ribosomal protein L30E
MYSDTCDVYQVKLIVVLQKLNETATSNLYFFNFNTDLSDISVYMYTDTILH